jgi:catechol-2,3-dioxygenase
MEIQELILQTKNLAATISFYKDILDMQVLTKADNYVRFAAGNSILTFQESDLLHNPVYHFAFNIPENQITEAIKWTMCRVELLPVTETSKIADYKQWNAHAIYFQDNNGNVLEFIARHDLRNTSLNDFSAAAIQCISEIGLVTAEVPEYTDQLMGSYALSLFSKQPRQENFAALGDDHGLFIIVGNERCWFPTAIRSEKYPLKIIFSNGGSSDHLKITSKMA